MYFVSSNENTMDISGLIFGQWVMGHDCNTFYVNPFLLHLNQLKTDYNSVLPYNCDGFLRNLSVSA